MATVNQREGWLIKHCNASCLITCRFSCCSYWTDSGENHIWFKYQSRNRNPKTEFKFKFTDASLFTCTVRAVFNSAQSMVQIFFFFFVSRRLREYCPGQAVVTAWHCSGAFAQSAEQKQSKPNEAVIMYTEVSFVPTYALTSCFLLFPPFQLYYLLFSDIYFRTFS